MGGHRMGRCWVASEVSGNCSPPWWASCLRITHGREHSCLWVYRNMKGTSSCPLVNKKTLRSWNSRVFRSPRDHILFFQSIYRSLVCWVYAKRRLYTFYYSSSLLNSDSKNVRFALSTRQKTFFSHRWIDPLFIYFAAAEHLIIFLVSTIRFKIWENSRGMPYDKIGLLHLA